MNQLENDEKLQHDTLPFSDTLPHSEKGSYDIISASSKSPRKPPLITLACPFLY
ncbi:hypothetical protein COCC4DRAFT_30747, partial [Bipolaris maydis ATCC 48331]